MTRNLACVILAAALACGCATTKNEPPPKPFVGTRWQAVLDIPLAGEQPWVRFGDGRLEGSGGCNRIAGRYVEDTVGARAIAIGRIESGRRGCDTRARQVEQGWLEVLGSVSSYSIVGDTMTMSGSAGSLRFRAEGEGKKQ